ncbi:MAG: hypothetical protein V4671_07710 [Armatimonadota bacterium]
MKKRNLLWRDLTAAWLALTPVCRFLWATVALVSTVGWLGMGLLMIGSPDWWQSHRETAFRQQWLLWNTGLWLISVFSVCGFFFYARKED